MKLYKQAHLLPPFMVMASSNAEFMDVTTFKGHPHLLYVTDTDYPQTLHSFDVIPTDKPIFEGSKYVGHTFVEDGKFMITVFQRPLMPAQLVEGADHDS